MRIILNYLSLCFRRKQTSYAMSSLPMAAESYRGFVLSSKQAYWLQNFASYGSRKCTFKVLICINNIFFCDYLVFLLCLLWLKIKFRLMSPNLVIIPTYNEKENIENIIRAVFAREVAFELLIIDDGSPDGTANIVKQLQKEFPDRLHILERKGKLGLGTAYIAGFKWALDRKYDYIFEMDADFSHNPNDLVKLYKACSEGGADVAIGSRYVSGVNVVNWPIG